MDTIIAALTIVVISVGLSGCGTSATSLAPDCHISCATHQEIPNEQLPTPLDQSGDEAVPSDA